MKKTFPQLSKHLRHPTSCSIKIFIIYSATDWKDKLINLRPICACRINIQATCMS